MEQMNESILIKCDQSDSTAYIGEVKYNRNYATLTVY